MQGENYVSAIQDFQSARRQAALQQIIARLTGKSVALLSYEEVRERLKARESRPRVLKDIPLDAIVGSVGRYTDFTRSFLPRQASDRDRWARVSAVMTSTAGLPPIEVYQIGEAYFVMDGNHRVSVARQFGASHIEAHVIEIKTKVPLSPDVQLDDLIVKAEHVDFLEHTQLDQLRPEADLTVTAPGQYEELEQHIEVQQFLLEMEQEREVPYEEAVIHWYDELYWPVVQAIREQGVLRAFPGRTETDLYIWAMKHRVALERELGWEIGSRSAVADLAAQFSPKTQRVVGRMSRRILHAVTPEGMEAGPPPGAWRRERVADQPGERLFADILVAINAEESGWHALDRALEVARHEGGRLYGLHVLPSTQHKDSEAARSVQTEFERRCREAGIPGKLALEVGKVPLLISERARLVDLVVLSLTHAYDPGPVARLGSGLHTIIRRCPTPVLVVAGPKSRLNRVLLAFDGSPKAKEALFVATYLAGQRNVPLVVVTVMGSDQKTHDTLSHARDYVETRGVEGTYLEARGPVAVEILIAAEENDCDLIIMGGYGISPFREIAYGSTVGEILRSSSRSVLICR